VHAGERGGRFDRILPGFELVDETELLGLFAEPDAPTRNLVDPPTGMLRAAETLLMKRW
jgi:hypothetical protein